MKKQLCINRLPLPCELLSIIKEFAFYNWIHHHALEKKNIIIQLINSSPYTNKHIYTSQPFFKFWISGNHMCNKFQMLFCPHCGNYFMQQSAYYEKIQCKC